ncbi:transposase [uncultured Duncaniella sp.]|uniref:transposase n=1 Tax=uncultured Duncaniella sp. TaxID=2768039 RepID=UPI0033A12DD3
MFDAIMFFNVFGCQWQMLPAERPKRQTVHYYFRRRGAKDAFLQELLCGCFRRL